VFLNVGPFLIQNFNNKLIKNIDEQGNHPKKLDCDGLCKLEFFN